MSSGLHQRTAPVHSHNGVGFALPELQKPVEAPSTNGYSPVPQQQGIRGAEDGNIGQTLDSVPSVFGAIEKYGGRRISLWGGVDLEMALAGPVAEEANKWANLLTWGRAAFALLFLAAAVTFSFVAGFSIKHEGKYSLWYDPISFNKLDNKWEASLENAGSIWVSWMLVAMLYIFAIYQGAHFVPFVARVYARFVFGMRMNPIRWIFHGLAGGIILGGLGLIMGVSNVIVFVFLVLTALTGAASILFMELINRPTLTEDYDETIDNDFLTIGGKRFAVRYSAINPYPYLLAVLALLTYVAITWTYFWHSVSFSSGNVPWFAWAVAILVPIIFVIMAAVNGIRYLVNWTIFRYFYVDILHVVVVDGGMLVASILVLIGMAVV